MISNLIINELEKEFNKKYLYIFIFLIIFISGLIVYFSNKHYIEENNNNYVEKIEQSNYESYGFYSNYEQYKKQYKIYDKKLLNDKKISDYIYKNNFENNLKIKTILEKSFVVSLFVMLIVSIVGGSIISYEYNKGSIKMLLTKPVKRSKILFSKFITVNLINFILLLTIIISMTLFVCVISDINIFDTKEVIIVNDSIKIINYYLYFLKQFFINSLPIFFIGNFSLMLSALTLNTALSVGLSVFISITAGTITQFLLLFKLKFIEFTFLPYLDFTIFKNYFDIINLNIMYGVNLNLISGIIILIIYSIIFYLLSYFFINRDVK